jgi:hypothetical protein
VFHIKDKVKLINEIVQGRKPLGFIERNPTGFDHETCIYIGNY